MCTLQARRLVAMASSHDLLVIPHGSSVYSYHLQFAFTNCPLAEYINLSPEVYYTLASDPRLKTIFRRGSEPNNTIMSILYINFAIQADKLVPYFGGLFPDEPLPSNGFIELPER